VDAVSAGYVYVSITLVLRCPTSAINLLRGATMWKPLDPDVFTHERRPSSESRSRRLTAAARIDAGSSVDGSRSKTHRSG